MMTKLTLTLSATFSLIFTFLPGYAATNLSHPTIKNIVVFGDSLSDSGNNKQLSPTKKNDISKAPIVNLEPGKPQNSTWITYLVHHLNPNANLINWKTFKRETAKQKSLANVNLSWASAESGSGYVDDHTLPHQSNPTCKKPGQDPKNPQKNCVPNIQTQIQLYFAKLSNTPINHTLFIIFSGSNDLFSGLQRLAHKPTPADIKTIISSTIKNLANAVIQLQHNGVANNNIVVFNLPDLSKIPDAQTNPEIQQLMQLMASEFNAKLNATIKKLGVHLYDDFSWMFNILKTDHSRVAHGFKPVGIAGSNCIDNDPNGVLYKGFFISDCKNHLASSDEKKALRYFFVNGKHPTRYAQKKLAVDISHYLIKTYGKFFL